MNGKFKLLASSLVLAAALGVAGQANALTIDSFNNTTHTLGGSAATPGTQVAAPEAIGGFRQFDIVSTNGGNVDMAANQVPTAGALSISNNAGTISTTSVTWNGNNTGLFGGVDLTDGGTSTSLLLSILSIDIGGISIQFDITEKASAGNSTATKVLSGLTVGVQTFAFNTFTNFADVDFTQIRKIQMTITTLVPASDLVLVLVQTNKLPEPSSLVLMGLGLAGFSFMRKRKAA